LDFVAIDFTADKVDIPNAPKLIQNGHYHSMYSQVLKSYKLLFKPFKLQRFVHYLGENSLLSSYKIIIQFLLHPIKHTKL